MNLASIVLLDFAVGYSGWADQVMAGWKLPVGTAALRHCSSTGNRVMSVNSYQLKRNVKVHSGTARS